LARAFSATCHLSAFQRCCHRLGSARRGFDVVLIRFDGIVTANAGSLDVAGRVAAPAKVWSHRCGWAELAGSCAGLGEVRGDLDLGSDKRNAAAL
jgi:hypothetical protein